MIAINDSYNGDTLARAGSRDKSNDYFGFGWLPARLAAKKQSVSILFL